MDKAVISTGGGVPKRQSNMRELEKNGKVFFLSTRPETVWERVKNNVADRPLLAVKDPLSVIRDLLQQRQGMYGRCHHVVVTDGKSVEDITSDILKRMPV